MKNTFTLTNELETFFLIILASAIGLFAAFYLRSPRHFQNVNVTAPLPNFIAADSPTPTPTPVPFAPKISTTSWLASDGNEKITMKTTVSPQVSSTYAFTVTNINTQTDTPLFVETIPGISSMSIPFNAFSSDDSYLFIKQTLNNQNHYLVFKTSGEPFSDGKIYFDVTPLFANFTSSLTLSDVTGWASPTLLIINTKKPDGGIGTSYWLDVTTRGIIPLATLFE